MPLELKRAQASAHKTIAQLPVGSGDGNESALEPVEIWFRPLTAILLDELEAARKGEELTLIEAKALWLSKCLIRWTITDNGTEVAPSLDVLKTLNRIQLDALIEAINEYTYPKERT